MQPWLIQLLLLIGMTANAQTVAVRHEVLITELMPDPSPVVGLPAGEFIEVTNISARTIDLKGWKVTDGNSTGVVPQSLNLSPGSRVILCSRGYVGEFSSHGTSVGFSGFPSLDNDGDLIVLQSPEGRTIHAVAYNPSWYGNAVKASGGWSLEMIDEGSPCLGAENWTASRNPLGGSPGRPNSVEGTRRDSVPPRLLRTYALDSMSLVAVFSESLDSASAGDRMRYEIDRQMGRPFSVKPLAPLFDEVAIRLAGPLNPKTVYMLSAQTMRDCAGNPMETKGEVRTGWPERPVEGQIRINEILFDPVKDGSDYVEVLNLGPGIVDASRLFLGPSSAASQAQHLRKASEKPLLFFPGDHLVFTEDKASLLRQHSAADDRLIVETGTLPSLPDDSGSLAVMDAAGRELDAFRYSARMHHPLLYDRQGIALERVDPRSPTMDPSNWHSASTDAGYGSPTRRNTQYAVTDTVVGVIHVEPATISPDMDGRDDLLTVSYRFRENGYRLSMSVYDIFGRKVAMPVRNALCGTEGRLRWNGMGEADTRLPSGPYYLVMEASYEKGRNRMWRRPVVVAYRR
jgi:hypothetical protein